MPYVKIIVLIKYKNSIKEPTKVEVNNIILKDNVTNNLLKISMKYGLEHLTK